MQDTDKPVNIDTSGPGAEVELDSVKEELIEETIVEDKIPAEDKSHENERETKLEDGGSADDAIAKSDEPTDVQASEENTEKKKELEEYSEGVKRRIAKLTKKADFLSVSSQSVTVSFNARVQTVCAWLNQLRHVFFSL